DNYGRDDPEKTAKVKALYEELDVRGIYTRYEKQSYQRLLTLINQHCTKLPREVFLAFAQKIYKRDK
ncbi:hypothetical protein scyTo_0026041, partial [Scyliorhinus torazame]|nr:hypothetical protein [Scyliorhinus torazame]